MTSLSYERLISAAFSKASARERSPTEQYKMTSEILFSRRTFPGARFAERTTGLNCYTIKNEGYITYHAAYRDGNGSTTIRVWDDISVPHG